MVPDVAGSSPVSYPDGPDKLAHQGFRALRLYIEEKQPKYLIHGHTYPTADNIVTHLGNTQIIYVYQDQILNLTNL